MDWLINFNFVGYFTTYPEIKYAARYGERIERQSEILTVLANIEGNRRQNHFNQIMPLKEGSFFLKFKLMLKCK